MNRFKLSIGDWSQDGHNQYDIFVYSSNYSVEDLRVAYKNSCRKTGIQFNHIGHEGNYTGLKLSNFREPRVICSSYEENKISKLAMGELSKVGIDILDIKDNDGYVEGPDRFAKLIMDFVSFSMPSDFRYIEASYKRSELSSIPPLNGWWNKELNVGFGYGIYNA